MNNKNDLNLPYSILHLTGQTVAAYVACNRISTDALLTLVPQMYNVYDQLASNTAKTSPPEPAVPISESVCDDFIVCLEDGHKLKMLKRYLARRFNLTPEAYRARWNLPDDYPMVAPAYARHRSSLAKRNGLGRKRSA